MKTIRLFLFKIKRANYARAWQRAAQMGKETGHGALYIMADMLMCSLKYGAALTDYHMFEFHKKSASERKKFLTMSGNNKLIAALNDTKYRRFLDIKTDMAERYAKHLHREFLVLAGAPRDNAIAFIERNQIIFAKKNNTFSAKGIARFKLCDYESGHDLYAALLAGGYDLIEEPIVQHKDMAELYPDAVNTVRVVTICGDIVFAALKCGNGGVVDNMNAGGISCAVNTESGVVYTDGVVKGGGRIEAHPITGVSFSGFKIPMWQSVTELVKALCAVTPQIRLVGWDIAITPYGAIMVEGNYLPGYDLLQLPDMTGRKFLLDKYVKRM